MGVPIITRQLVKELNGLLVLGIAAAFLLGAAPNTLKFLFVLGANLAYVGAFGYLLLNIPGWKIRVGIVIGLLFMKSLQEGMFHDLIVWSASLVLVLAYSRQWSRRRILSVMIAGCLAITTIISIKEEYLL